MSDDKIKLRKAVAREREAAALLGEEIVRLARMSFPDKSLFEYVEIAYGGLDELREERRRQETVRLARRRDSARRQTALELADQFGVDRAIVEAELDREEGA